MKILLLHGWLLERSGSNVYTAALATHLSAQGHEVHVFCQERHPDRLDFLQEAWVYDATGGRTRVKEAPPGTTVSCTLHRPDIGNLLPVYNLDEYEGFNVVKRFVDIEDDELESYFSANLVGLETMFDNHDIDIEVPHKNINKLIYNNLYNIFFYFLCKQALYALFIAHIISG